MEKEKLQTFIDKEVTKAAANYSNGVYSLDKAIGHIAGVSQLATLIGDEARIAVAGRKMWELREENDYRLQSVENWKASRNFGSIRKGDIGL
jgi:hypothetical protein